MKYIKLYMHKNYINIIYHKKIKDIKQMKKYGTDTF